MSATTSVYDRVRDLVESIGGSMTFHAGSGPGGAWELTLHGVTARISCRDRRANDLDRLYRAAVDEPRTWDDFAEDAPLVDDAFWRLVDLVRFRAVP